MLSHVNLETLVDEVELDNTHDTLSNIFGVLGKLSAIDLDNKCDKLLAIFDELAVGVEIHCEIVELETL